MKSEGIHRKSSIPFCATLPARGERDIHFHAALGIRFALCSAAHTVCGVAGIVRSSLPIASVMALMTAGGAAIAPASPQPLMPSGLDGHFVIVVSTVNRGRFCARGMQ